MPKPMIAIIGMFLFAAIVPQLKAEACGADASSSISTDRPQITNSSVIVPCGSLQLENGLQESSSGGQRTYDLPETSVRFGVDPKTELRLAIPDYFNNYAAASGPTNGLGDVSLGMKQQLRLMHGFDFSLIPSLSLPSGSNAISSHGYGPGLQFPWSRAVSKNWTAAGMLSLIWPTQSGRHNMTGQSSVYFDHQLTAPWDTYFEYSGAFPQRGGPQHILNIGTAYKPSPLQQFDLHVAIGLSAAVPDYSVGVGYSVRFQLIRPK